MIEATPQSPPSPETFYGTELHRAAANFLLRNGSEEQNPDRVGWIKKQFDDSFEYATQHNRDPSGIYFELHAARNGEFIPLVAIERTDYTGDGEFGAISERSGHNLAQSYDDQEHIGQNEALTQRPTRLARAGIYGLVSETRIGTHGGEEESAEAPVIRGRVYADQEGRKIVEIEKDWLDRYATEKTDFNQCVAELAKYDIGVELYEGERPIEITFEKTGNVDRIQNSVQHVSVPREKLDRSGDPPRMVLRSLQTTPSRQLSKNGETAGTVQEGEALKFDWAEGYARNHTELYEAVGLEDKFHDITLNGQTFRIAARLDYREEDYEHHPYIQVEIEAGKEDDALAAGAELGMIESCMKSSFEDLLGKDVVIEFLFRENENRAYRRLDFNKQA